MADENTPATEPARSSRKVREGTAVSTSMDKTVIVAVIERVRHPRYAKTVQRTKRLYAHDEHERRERRRPRPCHGDPTPVEAEALAGRRGPRAGEVTETNR